MMRAPTTAVDIVHEANTPNTPSYQVSNTHRPGPSVYTSIPGTYIHARTVFRKLASLAELPVPDTFLFLGVWFDIRQKRLPA